MTTNPLREGEEQRSHATPSDQTALLSAVEGPTVPSRRPVEAEG